MNNTNPRIGYRSTEVEDTEETKRQTVRKQKWSGRRLLVSACQRHRQTDRQTHGRTDRQTDVRAWHSSMHKADTASAVQRYNRMAGG